MIIHCVPVWLLCNECNVDIYYTTLFHSCNLSTHNYVTTLSKVCFEISLAIPPPETDHISPGHVLSWRSGVVCAVNVVTRGDTVLIAVLLILAIYLDTTSGDKSHHNNQRVTLLRIRIHECPWPYPFPWTRVQVL